MKKKILPFLLLTNSIIFGQIGIYTSNPHPSSDLELGSTDKALYLNRVANSSIIANPQAGMMIYDLQDKCVKAYQGEPAAWSDCFGKANTGSNGSVASLTCSSAEFSPTTATQGSAYSGILTVPYTGGNGGTYPAQSFANNGLTFTLSAGTFNTGAGNLIYNVTGSPVTAGTTSVNITAGGQSCSGIGMTVNSVVVPSNSAGTGSLSGRMCFDVVEVNNGDACGLLSSRMPQKANFAQTATNTQIYTFTPSGTVSNVRFIYINTKGQVIQSLTGGNTGNNITGAVTATVVYYNNLNAAASGLTRDNALTADIYVIYNDGATNNGTDRQLKLTAKVQDCACCGAPTNTGGYLYFMCHNLGADQTADPFTPSWKLNGGYGFWGFKGPDNWQTSPNTSRFAAPPTGTTAALANSGTISGWATPGSGLPSVPANAWNSGTATSPVKTALDPCPTGYRVPTSNEWNSILVGLTSNWVSIGTWTNSTTNYSSGKLVAGSLYLPGAGQRNYNDGSLFSRGSYGHYWASTTLSAGTGSRLEFTSSSVTQSGSSSLNAAYASTVRCVQE